MPIWIRYFVCMSLLGVGCIFATTIPGSVTLFNDSPFILTATVQGADGSFLGQFTIQPGQQSSVTTNFYPTKITKPGTPEVSLTPYSVIWRCAHGGFYSYCRNVPAGGMIRATDCPGVHYCQPDQESESASSLKKT